MRNELELIEKIERYLQGELTIAEKAAFDEQLANDPGLQEAVQIQREVMKGIERTAVKQQVQHAAKQFRLGKLYTKLAWGGLITAVVITAVILYYKSKSHEQAGTYEGHQLPAYNEAGEKQWADADRNLPAQVFVLNTGKDTVIETKQGIVLSVPANGFTDEAGRTVHGHISLVVKEALDAATIMQAGLSTTAGGRLLETGGMFFIDARQNNKILKIDPANAIYAEIPTDTIKPGMQLFTGKRNADGTIDWVNPKPLEHDLVPVDILQLDFYPPNYIDSLAKWGYNTRDKQFTDSLYYSFAAEFYTMPVKRAIEIAEEKWDDSLPKEEYKKQNAFQLIKDTKDSMIAYGEGFSFFRCGINPAKIKAIWNPKFQNSLLATREFRERLQKIHLTGNNNVLDLYVNNHEKPLWMIDSMAAEASHPNVKALFRSFAARYDGSVRTSIKKTHQLQQYYQRKTRAFTEAASKTQNEFRKKQAILDQLAANKKAGYQQDSIKRVMQNFTNEFTLNLKDTWRQLGYDTTIQPPPANLYKVTLTTTGWNNVDRYIMESTINRTTLDYTDPVTGKKAVIQYKPFSIQVQQAKIYDRLYVYLLSAQLTSFVRITDNNGVYTEKLSELIQYRLVCIAWKGNQAFYNQQDVVEAKAYAPVVLVPIANNKLERDLKSMGSNQQAIDILAEQAYRQFEWQDNKRQQRNISLRDLKYNIGRIIFPCYIPIGQ